MMNSLSPSLRRRLPMVFLIILAPVAAVAGVSWAVGRVESVQKPPTAAAPSELESLIQNAGFVDMRGAEAPNLALTDAVGKVQRLADLKGKFVLINFWGTNCVHCVKELPHWKDLETEYAGRCFVVLHVCADADDASVAQEQAEHAAPGIKTFVDESGIGLAQFEVQILPTFWLIGPDGKAIARAHGAKDWQSPAIRKLIEFCLSR